MPVTPDRPSPYAPPSAVIDLIERHRNKGLPSPVDAEVLGRAQISDSLIPRTLQALQALDLIDAEGKPTDVLEGIRRAPEAEYQNRLADWLRAAYADALQYVDPSQDDETAIRDAFRNYNPIGQQSRMVSLFMGLFRAAGIAPERATAAPKRRGLVKPAPARPRLQIAKAVATIRSPPPAFYGGAGSMPPALAGLLASLPLDSGGWTRPDRARFLAAFEAVLDFAVPLIEAPLKGEAAPEPGDDDDLLG